MAEGKEVKFFCVGRKGYEQLRRLFDKQIVEHMDLRAVRQLAFGNAEDIAHKVIARFEAGEFDVCTLFYSRFRSVISQVPTAQQIIPLEIKEQDSKAGLDRPTNTSRRRTRSSRSAAAQPRGADLPCAAREQRLVLRRADVARWTTPPATPAT